MEEQSRLKADIWVKALIRQLDSDCITAVVVRSGDPRAGAVYLKTNDLGGSCRVYSRSYGREGKRVWSPATGDTPVPEDQADDYIRRQVKFDPDCWVIEIEDTAGRFDVTALI